MSLLNSIRMLSVPAVVVVLLLASCTSTRQSPATSPAVVPPSETSAASAAAAASREAALASEREAVARQESELAAQREALAKREAELAMQRQAAAKRAAELASLEKASREAQEKLRLEQAEAEARQRAAAEAAKRAEEARIRAEVESRKQVEAAKFAEEARLRAEAKSRRQAEAARLAEEARKQAEAEAKRLVAEEEARRQAAAEETKRQAAEDARRQVAAEEAARRQAAVAEAARQAALLRAREAAATQRAVGSVQGMVRLVDDGKNRSPKDVMLALEPDDQSVVPPRPAKTFVVDTERKQFTPRFLTVRVGDSVAYANGDPFKHNVFSLTPGNKFDLGTYGKGTLPSHTFQSPGFVKIYCNIHSEMASFVMASTSDWHAIIDSDGRFSFADVPAGQYTLKAWSVRGSATVPLTIKAGGTAETEVVIDASSHKFKPHSNKDGRQYKRRVRGEEY